MVSAAKHNIVEGKCPTITETDIVKKENKVTKPRKKKKLLTDDIKRENHIKSEQKRREMIRECYDILVGLIPDLLEEEKRSELVIYEKTIAYIKSLYHENEKLRNELIEYCSNGSGSNAGISNELIWEISDLKKTK
ncbi:Ino4p SCDLUD_005079 [Saccharomycodes ludwigii]|uniref:Ino4p n=1 Tax=Saccharomycodes ludwigii TaxID=36035 RepID=UPI001E8404A8|nr:hypothetical protein SCDLUD_005079 [Saccharomycodes ludwigii]KAH3898750.1 hypothetical protein SCDLUD_005079 [Saccharomycodes ludwigii]